MTAPILAAASFCLATTAIHFVSIAIAGFRLRRAPSIAPLSHLALPPVSLVRPLCGIDNYATETLRTSFELDYPCCEVLFCVASAKDPVIPLVEALIAEHEFLGQLCWHLLQVGDGMPWIADVLIEGRLIVSRGCER